MPANLGNSAMDTGLEKDQFSFQSQRKVMPKNVQTTAQLHSSHMLASNAKNSPRDAPTVHKPWTSRCSCWIYKRQRNQRSICQHPLDYRKNKSSRKTSTSALLIMSKLLTVWITTNCGRFFKRWEYQTTWPASWDICMHIKKQQLELDMEQQSLVPNWERNTSRLCIVTLNI